MQKVCLTTHLVTQVAGSYCRRVRVQVDSTVVVAALLAQYVHFEPLNWTPTQFGQWLSRRIIIG